LISCSIGDASLISKIKSRIKLFPGTFIPADSVTVSLNDIKSKHSVIMLAQTPSNDLLRIEADFDDVFGAKTGSWQIGSTSYFKQTGRKARLNVGILGLNRYVRHDAVSLHINNI
jgi:hypothetical protein